MSPSTSRVKTGLASLIPTFPFLRIVSASVRVLLELPCPTTSNRSVGIHASGSSALSVLYLPRAVSANPAATVIAPIATLLAPLAFGKYPIAVDLSPIFDSLQYPLESYPARKAACDLSKTIRALSSGP